MSAFPDAPRLQGWYVDLPCPAAQVFAQPWLHLPSEQRAAMFAQAAVYTLRGDVLSKALLELQRGPSVHEALAFALTAEDAVRRGELQRACEALAQLRHASPPVAAWAGLRRADTLERLGQLREAEQQLASPAWDIQQEPPLLRPLVEARLRFRAGRIREAVEVLERARGAVREAAPPVLGAYQRTLAIYLGLSGHPSVSLHHHRAALTCFRSLGDELMLAKEYLTLAQGYQDGDELDHAEFFLRKAAELVEQLDSARLAALLAARRGMLALMRGDLPAARDLFQRDLELCETSGHRHGLAFAQRNLAKVLVRLGFPTQAYPLLAASVSNFAAMADPLNEHLSRLEEISARLADNVDAATLETCGAALDDVDRYFRSIGRNELLPQVDAIRPRLYLHQGHLELSRTTMHTAGQALLAQQRPERLVESLLLFASACVARSEHGLAVEQLTWAYRESVRAGRPSLSAVILERLGAVDEQAVLDLSATAPLTGERFPSAQRFEAYLLASRSKVARAVIEEARRVAPTEETVLIEGETGVGKSVLARFIHASSARAERQLVAINCGAIAESLLESELFGHEKGAFTGATARRIGLLEAASGGTVFLDEVGELSQRAQVTLLRFLEDRQVRPVGASVSRPVDVRIIAATNRDLLRAVAAGEFRADLYYRIAAYPIRLPPLRERRADLSDLAAFILERTPEAQRKGITGLSKGALARLAAHPWPGNLRELDNALRGAAIRCQGKRILERDLPPDLSEPRRAAGAFPTLEEVQRRHVQEALRLAQGNKSRAARLLGVHRNTLRAWLAADQQ